MVGADLEETGGVVGGVDVLFDAFCYGIGTEDNRFARGGNGFGSHGRYEIQGVLAGCIGYVYGTTGDAACGSVEGGVWVGGLEHVPVG